MQLIKKSTKGCPRLKKIFECKNNHETTKEPKTEEKSIRNSNLASVGGCQTWSLRDKRHKKLRTCQRAMERSMLRVKKIEKIRSRDIRQLTKLQYVTEYVKKQKWNWSGHIARMSETRWTKKFTI
ncbi:hypothetical protein ILUMI_20144 [Ignelater luminosus]|uniref:Uncharacterized protein n=1 Tax=Ignelater luminosus TaxID=2038154 RepID=A0A8K0CEU1_IGNLU|nr:hypothetical protein ILUMI_20144 [Ignelater luminosus]